MRENNDDLKTKMAALQSQTDAIDLQVRAGVRPSFNGIARKSLADHFNESPEFMALKEYGRGTARLTLKGDDAAPFLERKTTILESSLGFQSTGVFGIDRTPGIVAEARTRLFLSDLLTHRPTEAAVIDFVRVSQGVAVASPAAEASDKAENALALQAVSQKVQTIASWIPISRQAYMDLADLAAFLGNSLKYACDLAVELQMLSGDGTGANINGLIHQASSFNTGLLPGSPTRIDYIATAIEQIQIARELQPTFVVVNPADWWAMRMQKNTQANYILGDPSQPGPPNLWTLTPIVSPSIAAGSFLVGSSSPVAVEVRDRLEFLLEVSDSHASYFTQNLLAARGECRLALAVYRPGAFVYGTFA
jgi:HK97 family phage major capsid protein